MTLMTSMMLMTSIMLMTLMTLVTSAMPISKRLYYQHVIFNEKAYANGKNLKQWARQEYKWGSAFSPSDNEPRLLVLDVFSAHKSSADDTKARDDFVAELKKLNTTVSMVPSGTVGSE
jgi:hypothetical protein